MGKIFILEDEESVRRGIAYTLEKSGYQVYEANDIKSAKAEFTKQKPDLLLCDINLPDGDGLDFIRWVRQQSNTHIICLTARDEEVDFVLGYEAGADDYVAKPFSLSVLAMKIAAYFERNKSEKSSEIKSGNLCLDLDKMTLMSSGVIISLTKSEWKLIQFFMQNPGQILTKSQLLERVFDVDGEFIDENTMAVYIRRLREKIEEDSANPKYIKNIRGIGYIWTQETNG